MPADQIVARSPMRLTEERLGVVPIDSLLAQRAELVGEVADLKAVYGGWGTFEHIRKMELARLSGLVRATALRDKEGKVTQGEIDDRAHDHPDYRDLITQATVDRAKLYKLESKIEGIDQTIQRANTVIRYAASEARL